MTRAHILHEIQRTAKENDGKPLGQTKFTSETGIKLYDWLGVYWANWSDALREAGFTPNQFQVAFDKTELLDKYARLVLELGCLPASPQLRLKSRRDPTFPTHTVFGRRFGTKRELVKQLIEYCRDRKGYKDVVKLCEAYSPRTGPDVLRNETENIELGFVYLVKSGRYFKIGRSNAAGRRTYELDLQLPEKATTVHVIRTDDPIGIEAYWHTRFVAKRKNGEWFDLDTKDVSTFKRRKTM